MKELIVAEEQAPIQVKGFAKPVRNYRVLDQLDRRPGQGRMIQEEQDGMRIVLDLEKIDKTAALQALDSIISRLIPSPSGADSRGGFPGAAWV